MPLRVVAAMVTSAFSPEIAARLAYWSGSAAVAAFAGAVVHHRARRAAPAGR